MKVKVFIELCHENAVMPQYKNSGDAGMDVYAVEDVIIKAGETKIVKTGIKFAIPVGYEVQVRPRSGISYKTPIRIPNSPGTIDSGYRDELGIIINNSSIQDSNETFSLDTKGNTHGTYKIKQGDRVAQIILKEVPSIDFEKVVSVKAIGEDRGGGFGSTGVSE